VYDAQFRVKLPSGTRLGKAENGFVRLTLVDPPDTIDIEWSQPDDEPLTAGSGEPRFRLTVNVDVDGGDQQTNATKRLHNLGFPESDGFAANLLALQRQYGLPQTGKLDDA